MIALFIVVATACTSVQLTPTEITMIRDLYGRGTAGGPCPEELEESLVRRGGSVLPCLVQIFRHGVTGDPTLEVAAEKLTSFPYADGAATSVDPNTDGFWTIRVIARLDRELSVRLLEERAHTLDSTDPAVLGLVRELLWLGSRNGSPFVMAHLAGCRDSICRIPCYNLLSALDDREVLGALEKRLRVVAEELERQHLQLLIWKLKRDVAALARAVREGPSSLGAASVLVGLGRSDLVRQLAQQGRHPAGVDLWSILAPREPDALGGVRIPE